MMQTSKHYPLCPRSHSEPIVTPAYFPRVDTPPRSKGNPATPSRPTAVEPVFDQDNASRPLKVFDEQAHKINYSQFSPRDRVLPTSSTPPEFTDPYLFPSLSKDERLRLTMLWYHTKGLTENTALLARLQDKLNIVRELMGWEFAIMGILDNNVYTRIVTSGLPLAILPRRESTCAHTINQPAGSVFMIEKLLEDWRFKSSPHVEKGGLRSYAGTQICCKTESGQELALGSLCVASNSEMEPLSSEKQAILIRFADMLSAEIVTTSQLNRQRQRRAMGDLISKIQTEGTAENIEELILTNARQIYPNFHVSLQDSPDGSLVLSKRASPVPYTNFKNGLWEDSDYIDFVIETMNQEKLYSEQSIRVVAYQCTVDPVARYLIVETNEIQQIFDDVDSWFVERCSLIITKLFQERSIRETVEIKDRFFRGITHQLRTPIHGILGSCELLSEEFTAANAYPASVTPVNGLSKSTGSANILSYLGTIKSSGEELMSTINNMLKINRWSQISNIPPTANFYDIGQIESELCSELLQLVPEFELAQVTLYFQNEVSNEASLVLVDVGLLKDCLQSLLVNAVQYTPPGGTVIVVISTDAEYSTLRFDVIDTGCGIEPGDQQRIFRPYEKANEHSKGVGLGLTLACKIADALNGTVTLRSSTWDSGSHFRAEFREQTFACPYMSKTQRSPLPWLPKQLHEIGAFCGKPLLPTYFRQYLKRRGIEVSERTEDSLGLIHSTSDLTLFKRLLESIGSKQITIGLVPLEVANRIRQDHDLQHNVQLFTGPFTSKRLEEILVHVDKLYELRSMETIPPTPLALAVPFRFSAKTEDKPLQKLPIHPPPLTSLLVDDNPINLRIMRMYCETRHIPFSAAVDGLEAVNSYKSCADGRYPSIILMDLQMPNMDGALACEEIRKVEAERSLKPAVIFIVSGQDPPTDKVRCFKAGANDFLVKPVRLKTLDLRIKGHFAMFES